jgi:hypothetical protein
LNDVLKFGFRKFFLVWRRFPSESTKDISSFILSTDLDQPTRGFGEKEHQPSQGDELKHMGQLLSISNTVMDGCDADKEHKPNHARLTMTI